MNPEGGRSGLEPLYPVVGGGTVLWRGLRKRCPRCGDKGMFLTWATLRERCRRCGLRFEAEQGGFLGAMTLNFLFAVVVWLVVLVVALLLTVPDVPVLPLTLASVAVMVVMPVLLSPTSKSLWAAIEFLVLRSEPDYVAPVKPVDPRADGLE